MTKSPVRKKTAADYGQLTVTAADNESLRAQLVALKAKVAITADLEA